MVPNYEVEEQWLSVGELQNMWQLMAEKWPPILDHNELKLISQVHEAISIVRISSCPSSETFAFKSVTNDVQYLYHELKTSMTIPPHGHIISAPLYVVTKKHRFGGKVGVCGFILPYFTGGTLRHALITGAHSNRGVSFRDRIRWVNQIIAALIRIRSTPSRFYTDLKLNSILLTKYGGGLGALLVDFEQRGSWFSWPPPEAHHVKYLEMIATAHPDPQARKTYSDLLSSYRLGWSPHSKKARYADRPAGFSNAFGWGGT